MSYSFYEAAQNIYLQGGASHHIPEMSKRSSARPNRSLKLKLSWQQTLRSCESHQLRHFIRDRQRPFSPLTRTPHCLSCFTKFLSSSVLLLLMDGSGSVRWTVRRAFGDTRAPSISTLFPSHYCFWHVSHLTYQVCYIWLIRSGRMLILIVLEL